MLYTYILDDSIKSPTLILTADHSTLLFLPGFFYQIKNFLFLLWVNLYMITAIYLHDPLPFNGPFFMTPPFSESQKAATLPLFPHPSPLLISDKSLAYFEPTGSCFPNLICSRIVPVCNELSVHKYSKKFSSPCFNMPSKLFRTN